MPPWRKMQFFGVTTPSPAPGAGAPRGVVSLDAVPASSSWRPRRDAIPSLRRYRPSAHWRERFAPPAQWLPSRASQASAAQLCEFASRTSYCSAFLPDRTPEETAGRHASVRFKPIGRSLVPPIGLPNTNSRIALERTHPMGNCPCLSLCNRTLWLNLRALLVRARLQIATRKKGGFRCR
jgi:hypothetical protein